MERSEISQISYEKFTLVENFSVLTLANWK